LRWRIERDYQELKQEVGLGQFEGRGWRGFHHHATCACNPRLATSERETIPPQDLVPPGGSKNLPFPPGTDPAAPLLRPNAAFRIRSPPCADALQSPSPTAYARICWRTTRSGAR
jgi:hypothetical protein